MAFDPDSIQAHIPQYLSAGQKEGLIKALQSFPVGFPYFTTQRVGEILQGDGWTKVKIHRFGDGAVDKIWGIVLSNSCDIDPDNDHDIPPRITFAPLIELGKFAEFLRSHNIAAERIADRLAAIRAQKVWTLFYVPHCESLGGEHVALLDDLYTVPFGAFFGECDRQKLFTLSDPGFYLFVLKLSIHFCRFSENIVRDIS